MITLAILEISNATIIAGFIGAGTLIAGLAKIMWSLMEIQIKELKLRITLQDETIDHLQKDIERMSTGCGAESCIWRKR